MADDLNTSHRVERTDFMINITQTARGEQCTPKKLSKKKSGRVVSLPSKDRSLAASETTVSSTSEPLAEKNISQSDTRDAATREWAARYTDDEVLKRMFACKNGKKLKALWTNQWQGFYRSALQAESMLVSSLSFWLGRDAVRIERILRRRDLKRPEWYERQPDGQIYIAALIEKELSKQEEFYRPPRKQRKNQTSCSDTHGSSKSDKGTKAEEQDGKSKKPSSDCYSVEEGGFICTSRDGKEGTFCLTNFTAKIVQDTVYDDSATEQRFLKIEASITGRVRTCDVAATEFSQMGWVAKQLGSNAIIHPGKYAKDRVRAAIQNHSGTVPEIRIYRHTGWVQSNGAWVFLYSGGALGSDGIQTDLSADKLDRYDLSTTMPNVRECLLLSLRVLQLAPARIMYPLYASTFRGPLCDFLPCTTMPHLVGESGSLKSSVVAAMLGHYGRFAAKEDLPARWAFTGTILEKTAFLAKDVVLVIDDLNPEAVRKGRDELESNFSRIIGAVGDATGKRRATETLTTRQEFHPRGVILSTGEYTPNLPTSRQARLFIIPIQKGDVRLERLSEFQKHLAELPAAMAAFIDYIRNDIDCSRNKVRESFEKVRSDLAAMSATHQRLPENVAHLYVGLEQLMNFAQSIGALTEREVFHHLDVGLKALVDLSSKQSETIIEDRPTRIFIRTILEALATGECFLADRRTDVKLLNYVTSNSKKIGWADEAGVYLLPSASFELANERIRSRGGLHTTETELKNALKSEGYLKHTPSEKGRTEAKRRCPGHTGRVLWFSRDLFAELLRDVETCKQTEEDQFTELCGGKVE
jgi:hypothetical protein